MNGSVSSPLTMDGVAQHLCQLLASVPLGSKLQDLQREGHTGRRNDNIGSISRGCSVPVKAKRKLGLQ